MTRLRMLLPLFLLACGTPAGLGGDEVHPGNPEDPYRDETNGEALEVDLTVESYDADPAAFDDTCDGEAPEPTLALTASAETIHVVHEGYVGQCCPLWEVAAEVTDEGWITVTYEDTAEDPCDCTCDHTLAYDIRGVPAGTWTVEVPDLTEEITVP